MSNLLKETEAAAFFNIKPETMTRWRWAGTGPRYFKVGGSVRYRIEDLEAFLQSSECGLAS